MKRYANLRRSACSAALALLPILLLPLRTNAQQMAMMPPEQAALIHSLLPTVVNITSYVRNAPETAAMAAAASTEPAGTKPKTLQGSGFFIDPSGVILTNYHVIDSAYEIQVTLSDGTRVEGRMQAAAPTIDLALVKIDIKRQLPVAHWADSDKVQVGDTVFAIGNPLGIGLSVSSGIVSALNRNLMDTPFDDFIQTDAAINHGNSGGPLFNRNGDVIGVDTAIISPTTGSVGLGFAIPANDANFVAGRLMQHGMVQAGYIGANFEEVTPDIAAALNLSKPAGSIVTQIKTKQCPASVGGLQVGDVVLRWGDQTPADSRALLRDVGRSPVGKPVAATISRDGRELVLTITPALWPEPAISTVSVTNSTESPLLVPANLGLSLAAVTPDSRAKYGLTMHQSGVLISGVTSGTDAYQRGLAPGDVILRTQHAEVSTPEEVQAAIDAARTANNPFVLFLVQSTDGQSDAPKWRALRVKQS